VRSIIRTFLCLHPVSLAHLHKCRRGAGAQERKRTEGRKTSHNECIFHGCVERPPANGFQPNLMNVFVRRTCNISLLLVERSQWCWELELVSIILS